MDIQGLGRLLIIFGALLLIVGVVLAIGGKLPLLGRLPGDLVFRRGDLTVVVPLATMLLVSLVLTILLNLFFRGFR